MDLASKAGIATNFVNDIENEKKWISPATLAKICTALDIEPYKLFLEIDFENSSSNKKSGSSLLSPIGALGTEEILLIALALIIFQNGKDPDLALILLALLFI